MTSSAFWLAALALLFAAPTSPHIRRLRWLADQRFPVAGEALAISAATSVTAVPQTRGPLVGWLHSAAGPIARKVLLVSVTLGVGAYLGPVVGLLAAACLGTGYRIARGAMTERSKEASRAELIAGVGALAEEYRSGAVMASALAASADAAGRHSTCFRLAAADAARGEDGATSLLRANERGLVSLGVALRVAAVGGVPVTDVLAGVRADLEHERDLRRRVSVLLAGPRSSAALLSGLPALGLLLGAGLGARPLQVLLHTGVGTVALVCGVLFDLAGVWWTSRLTQRAVP